MNLQLFRDCLDNIDFNSVDKLKKIVANYNKIIILGNGGSNAISSHISEDYTKVLGKQAFSFSDPARLTCYANDYGWELTYLKFVEEFADSETLIILLSSSGNSSNIINVAEYCVKLSLPMITLSGFACNNKLRTFKEFSLLDFWIDSTDYGIVEVLHELILHSIL